MFGKGNKLYGIFAMKCPHCHEGDLFKTKNAYDFKHMADMYDKCPVCHHTYEPEPNFYYGSMYVSYAYTVAIFVATYIISAVFFGLSMWTTIGILVGLLVVLGPYLFRLSRVTWLSFFVKYNPEAQKEAKKNA